MTEKNIINKILKYLKPVPETHIGYCKTADFSSFSVTNFNRDIQSAFPRIKNCHG